uniref:NADH dehydrogenase [ubiquinone] 1 beta subcomplex subunit 11, mitochondrial n=1 Tax=Timema bartmani TaxID=61472 RepID=A0A7R9I294_9NEOP|nr:unnamed protein product [Timema bartmani]
MTRRGNVINKFQIDEVKSNEVKLSSRERFRYAAFNVVVDSLIVELQRRWSAYKKLSKRARNLEAFSPGDFDSTLENKCLHMQAHLLSTETTGGSDFTFIFAYVPDFQLRDWAQREAFLELRRREQLGLPPIDRNLIDPEKITLPTDEELGDTEIII